MVYRTLQVELLVGPGAGRAVTFSDAPVTFGRDAENTLILDEPFISRRHGRIERQGQDWVLINHSPNGTRVGRRMATAKPVRLRSGDVIRIGDKPVLRVGLGTAQEGVEPDDTAGAATGGGAVVSRVSLSRRARLWILLGVSWLITLTAFIFLLTLDSKPTGSARPHVPELTAQEIRAALLEPLAPRPPNAALARQRLAEARELAASLQASPSNLFKACRAYREALAYSESHSIEAPLDQLRFEDLQAALVREVTSRYKQAYATLQSRRFEEAATELARLNADLYHLFADDRGNRLYVNVLEHQETARRNAPRR